MNCVTLVVPISDDLLKGLSREIGSKQYRSFVYLKERQAAIIMRETLESKMERLADDS